MLHFVLELINEVDLKKRKKRVGKIVEAQRCHEVRVVKDRIFLQDILTGGVETTKLPLKMGLVTEILKDQFNFDPPKELTTLFGLDNPEETFALVDAKKITQRGKLQDIVFISEDAGTSHEKGVDFTRPLKTIHLDLRSDELSIAGVVHCKDGVDRVAAVQYSQTIYGWVLTQFILSANGFDDEFVKFNNISYQNDAILPTDFGHPNFTAGIVTRSMVGSPSQRDNVHLAIKYSQKEVRNYHFPTLNRYGSEKTKTLSLENPSDASDFFKLTNGGKAIISLTAKIPHV